ncbi:MAG: hypothetical protein KKF68_01965 [Nanoarchaeota archaeon]|nr:hypothetical protein [Nanoarchaeota archaeon]
MKKKNKIKKIIYRTIQIIWIIIGGLILLWTGFWYVKILTIGEIGGVLAGTVLLASGIYMLAIYLLLTMAFLLIKYIIKKIRK